MALKTVSIPITDHGTSGVCTAYYVTRYKASFDSSWTVVYPNPTVPPITITGLAPSTVFNYEITRYCCDGSSSNAASGTFTTPA